MTFKTIYIAHGAIKNSGDYLIFKRGQELVEKYLGSEDVRIVPVKRWESISGHCDILIILGGPLISRKMQTQSNNIKNYLDRNKVPVICLGVGISGEKFSESEQYFKDQESIDFWTKVYNSSQLFSVRDAITRQILSQYNIPTILTGCPALYDIVTISETIVTRDEKSSNQILTITIPNIDLRSLRNGIKSLFLLYCIRIKLTNRKYFSEKQVVFQHGFYSYESNLFAKIIKLMGFKTIDGSGRSISSISELDYSDVHIGTRLHMNIYFLSKNKLSYLLNIDNRTEAFLNTIHTPSDDFTIMGIMRLVDECYNDQKNGNAQELIISVRKQIMEIYPDMVTFLNKIKTLCKG